MTRTPTMTLRLALATILLTAPTPASAQPGPPQGTGGAGASPAAATPSTPTEEVLEEGVPEDAQAYLTRHLSPKDAAACMPDVTLARRPELPGQQPAASAEPALRRLVLAVDSSGSMRARVGGEAKIDAAKRAAAEFLAGVPGDVEVGLVAFGHRGSSKQAGKAESCAGVETVHELASASREAVRSAVDGLEANGWTPLAAAIDEAGASFTPAENPGEQVVYVVSDGLETCGGDPVAAARRLRESDVKAVVNIVGFDIEAKDRAQLRAVATAGGGRFLEAGTGRELQSRLAAERLANSNRAAASRVTASNASAATRVGVSNAMAGARVCVSNLLAGERIRLSNATAADRRQGRIDPALGEEASRLLQERHARISAALAAYTGAMGSDRDERLGEIAGDLERALAPPAAR